MIARASSSGSSKEIDAAQWMIRSTDVDQPPVVARRQAEAGLEQVAAHGAHAPRGRGRLVVEAREQFAQPLLRAGVIARADQHRDLLLLALALE